MHGVEVQSSTLHAADNGFDRFPVGFRAGLDFSSGPDDDFIAFGKFALDDAPADDAASKFGGACAGPVDVEGARHVHDGAGVRRSVGGRDGGLDGFDEHVEVDVVMSGNGNDRSVFSDGALEEGFDFAM